MAKRWQKTELDYLKRHAEAKTTAELAKHLRVAPASAGAKLGELGLRATPDAPGKPAAAAPVDPQLALYEQGVRAMYRARWAEAVRCFTQVATASDEPGLAERARQQAAACEQRQAEQGAGHAEAA